MLRNPEWNNRDLVFFERKGTHARTIAIKRAFRCLIRESAFPLIRSHEMRHTTATPMWATDEHPKIISERLILNLISILLDRYAHVSDPTQQEAANRLEALLDQPQRVDRSAGVTCR